MININSKPWERIRGADIVKLLDSDDDERFFIEFKSDDESPDKLMKEISAFANTNGGYILLGINDDKSIGGCRKWTEQRIHSTVHDCISPTPNIDVRRFKVQGKTVLVIKIEEGILPPYITNKGYIYERLSSGSFPVKDAAKVAYFYSKRHDQLERVQRKIELPPIRLDSSCPNNLCGYVDLGFNLTTSSPLPFSNNFFQYDLTEVVNYLEDQGNEYSISRVGTSLLICIGDQKATTLNGKEVLLSAGLNNFFEIMSDGSVRSRVLITTNFHDGKTSINEILFLTATTYRDLFKILMGRPLEKAFVHAQKYEKLTVIRQFSPCYVIDSNDAEEVAQAYRERHRQHMSKYGNNKIIEGNRHPRNDFQLIDKRMISDANQKFNLQNLCDALFNTVYFDLGYIESIDFG